MFDFLFPHVMFEAVRAFASSWQKRRVALLAGCAESIGARRAVAQLQIFDKTLPQRSHQSISEKEEKPRREATSCGK
jgi:hypothetical protein